MNRIFKKIILLIALGMVLAPAGAAAESSGLLTVKVLGFSGPTGVAMIAVSDSADAYSQESEKAFARTMQNVSGDQVQAVFQLPYGWYAISVYHDENGNGKLDTNALGIPKERYGFSNNARGAFGKPDWDAVRFEINQPGLEMVINLQ